MFCPNCGAEYREGFTVCSDCNVPLVNELQAKLESEFIKLVTVYKTGNPTFIAFAKSILQSDGTLDIKITYDSSERPIKTHSLN